MTAANTGKSVTCIAPVNIAVIKYWGKRDTKLILPTNSSLSVTLSTDDLHSRTTVTLLDSDSDDTFTLNGNQEPISQRLYKCLEALRLERLRKEQDNPLQFPVGVSSQPLRIESCNNFPTAAGLASSASGFACLVFTIANLFQLIPSQLQSDIPSNTEILERLSMIARLGSGSACRSLFGGYVKWEMGSLDNLKGTDSRAVQVASKQHWPDMRVCILVVDDCKKTVSSSAGMQSTVETSSLFQHRIAEAVPKRMQEMEQAILNRDFETFAKLTMIDSNQFHALCMDTFPPIYYMNDTSRLIVKFVHELNEQCKRNVIAYTFDAGPNACLYYLDKDSALVKSALKSLLRHNENLFKDLLTEMTSSEEEYDSVFVVATGSVKRVIMTRVGDGPKVVDRNA